jgi:hypothetical protein
VKEQRPVTKFLISLLLLLLLLLLLACLRQMSTMKGEWILSDLMQARMLKLGAEWIGELACAVSSYEHHYA